MGQGSTWVSWKGSAGILRAFCVDPNRAAIAKSAKAACVFFDCGGPRTLVKNRGAAWLFS